MTLKNETQFIYLALAHILLSPFSSYTYHWFTYNPQQHQFTFANNTITCKNNCHQVFCVYFKSSRAPKSPIPPFTSLMQTSMTIFKSYTNITDPYLTSFLNIIISLTHLHIHTHKTINIRTKNPSDRQMLSNIINSFLSTTVILLL